MKKIDPDKQILPRNGKGTLCRGIRLICTLFLLFAVSLPVYADKGTGRRFSLEIKNAYLSELFLQIEKSSNYSFVYADADIRALGKVSFKCTNATLTTILDRCLTKTDLEYKIDKNHVVISLRKGVATTAKAKEPEKTLFTVKGYVRDDKGQPVIGATVVQPNSNNAVITLTNGAYELATEANASLTFSYVGMKPQTVAINGRRIIDVVLLPDTEIGEVIISGYQTISRHQTTGAVNQIQMEDIKLGGNFSVDQMLSGQTPGVSITMTSGEPSAAPKIRIRGTSSILGNKAPLWVLDGVILDDPVQVNHQDLTGEDAAYLIGNAIGGVNPSDIETITILKDASATALYGTQATNGVIVVTTKRGSSGPTRIRYDGSFSVQERPSYSKMNLMNASQRIALSQEMLADNFTYTQIPDDIGYEALWLKYLRHGLTYDELTKEMNKMARRNTDWYDLLFNDSFSHNHTLSLSGGTDQVTYYASLGYNNTPTTAINGGSERYNANLKFGSWVTKKLYVGVNLLGSITKNKGYSTMAGINPNSYAYETARTIPAYNDDGTLFKYKLTNRRSLATDETGPVTSAQEDIVYNILNEMNTTGARGNITNINAQLNVQYEIIKGLKYELLGSIVHNNTKQFDYAMASSAYVSRLRGWNLGSSILSGEYTDTDWYQKSPIPLGGILSGQYNTSTTYTLRNTLRYSTVLAQDHTISAMAVSEIRSNPVKGSSATWYGWQPDRGLTIAPVVTNQFISDYQNGKHNPTLIDNEVHYVSWLGSVSYSYKDKWTINGNIRADGSNLFGDNPEYRFLPVWSVGAKYTMSNEPWLAESNVLSYLALRASYGVQGNVDKNTSPSLVIQVGSTNTITGLNQSSIEMLPNADLRWEKTSSYNFGIDFSFLGDLVSGTIDVYKKHGVNMITTTQVASISGVQSMRINSGIIDNSGVETTLSLHPVKRKDWDLYVNMNYSYNRNKLVKANSSTIASNSSMAAGTALIEDRAIGTLYSYNFAGLNAETGYPVFYDRNGATTTTITSGGEEVSVPNYNLYEDEIKMVESGVIDPPHYGGFDFTLRWKNLRLNAGFNYSFGAVGRLPGIYDDATNAFYASKNLSKEFMGRWRNSGDELRTNIPVLYSYENYRALAKRPQDNSGTRTLIEGTSMYDLSTARIARTDVLRMRNLSLSYIVPKKVVSKWGIESAMISLQATNLFFVADDAWGGMDPESGYASIPIPRTYTLNLSLTF